MPEKSFYQKPYLITENVGDMIPQTPELGKEFGEGCQGISRCYKVPIKFDGDPFAFFWNMMKDFQSVVPDDHRIVWTGYCVEQDRRGGDNGNGLQIGWMVKAWFIAYQIRDMDKLLKLKRE